MNTSTSSTYPFILLLIIFTNNFFIISSNSPKTSIVFTTLGRSRYNFDIYTLPIIPTTSTTHPSSITKKLELKITDGISVNFNGNFPSNSDPIFSLIGSTNPSSNTLQLLYVTERNGTSNIYFDSVSLVADSVSRPSSRSGFERVLDRVQVPLLGVDGGLKVSMKDRPDLVGENVLYVSTHESTAVPRTSWAAVYNTHILTGATVRFTPVGVADFSPAVSPSGVYTAVCSYGEKGWSGDVEELDTDIYVMLTRDGSARVKVVEHGGWPCWVDDHTLYFHRRDYDDGWWSVYKASLTRRSGHKNLYIMDAEEGETGGIKRLTYGPWSDTMCNWSPGGEWIAFASDRENPGGGSFEVFMIHPNGTGLHKVIQSGVGGRANHPWFSPDGKSIVFTSDYAGVSAEPISNPHHYQPYGEIFIANIDGSNILRLTHNSFEDGTPTWGSKYLKPVNVVQPANELKCVFEDCHWLNIKNNFGMKLACDVSSKAQCYDYEAETGKLPM